MLHLNHVAFIICIISSLKSKTLQKELGISHGDDDGSDDWAKMKWDAILKDPSDSELSNKTSTDDPNKLDELFFFEDDSNKKFKSKLKLSESELDDISKDDVFIEEARIIRKRSSAKNSVEPFPKGQINVEDLLNLQDKETAELTEKIESVNVEDNVDFSNESIESNVETESSKSSLKLDNSPLLTSDNAQSANNIAEQSDIKLLNPRSFIFNPQAKPQEQFQNCTTPKNESGSCRYLQHCLIPTIVSSLNQFMDYVCIIERRFIGVCCPNLPVSLVVIKDQKGQTEQESELNENCGIGTNTRIVGGLDADPKAWPWMVALFSKVRRKFFCGGALINDRYVLTAAHCTYGVFNNEIIARVGEYDFKDDGKSHQEYAVVEIKRHGRYNRRTLRNDIALLKLGKTVVFNEFVKTICFPEEEKDYVGEKATVAGWGNLAGGGATSDVLQQASVPVISNEKCSKGHGLFMPESLICTGSKSADKGACNGDSGGPLMLLDENNRWKVIGLVSWGRRGCSPEFPTVYTRVSYFLEWIKKHAR